ncbi:MAG: lamin tail domain-containing protein [candidate division KSB1 bacterium]|nr:lamin tail domain-containing protein [candidate division KSB1 bacterium]MDZ7303329.1 lamin tail domain-containing protein [candidate division KSB1 bacterium]MDZ7310421.1 lamin tail domain-containing protein [candidate division KSB1 bacterium]
MNKTTFLVLAALFVLAGHALAQMPQPLQTFFSPNRTASGRFGYAVTTVDDNLLIGAPGDTIGEIIAGAAYLFDGGTSAHLRTFLNPTPDNDDQFGYSVATLGSKILIGAPFDDTDSTDAGAVYLFDGTSGEQLLTIRNPFPNVFDRFGSSIAVVGNKIIIAAPFDDTSAPDAGTVYVFDATTGERLLTIPNPFPGGGDRFGYSLTAVGSNFVVGAPFDRDKAVTDAGAAYLFDGYSGQLMNIFMNQPRVGGSGLGFSVAAFGDNVLLGAPFDDMGATGAGVVYLFDATTGSVLENFPNPTPDTGDEFGAAITTIGDMILIGAPSDDAGATDAGAVHRFSAATGTLLGTFQNPTPATEDKFGYSIAAVGNKVLIGAPFDDTEASNAGAVYLFSLEENLSCQLTIISPRDSAFVCDDSVTVTAVTRITGGIPPYTIQYNVNGIQPASSDTMVMVRVPLSSGNNKLIASCTVVDALGNQAVGVDSLTISAFPSIHEVVINEILYDPNFNDFVVDTLGQGPGLRFEFGTEKIELKNISTADTISLDGFALWIRRGVLDTYWAFPQGIRLAPGGLLVVHWLGQGKNDRGNVFTGLPSKTLVLEPFRFWGNNSTSATNMTLGGPGNINTFPFAIALVQQITTGEVAGFDEPCRMVDFIQIGGRVTKIENIAVQARLWPKGKFVAFAKEGFSYELNPDSTGSILTDPGSFISRTKPSIGFRNPVGPGPFLPQEHLLISEVCVWPASAEFIEIFNPSSSKTIELANYFLADNGDYRMPNGKLRRNSYTRIVKGRDSLEVDEDDFFVHFPDGAKIGPRQYQTIAFRADRFFKRYGVKPTYEIFDTDFNVGNNMVVDKLGSGTIGLKDSNDVVILFKWVAADSSDLVDDVDYVVWNSTPRSGEEINKTGLAIDGMDADAIPSVYGSDGERVIPIFHGIAMIPLGKCSPLSQHSLLKSWQRRPDPREFDEILRGGNGLAGHNEISENLGCAFFEALATPNKGTKGLDLEYAGSAITETVVNGEANGVVNPGEKIALKIRLKNYGSEDTGPLFSILKTFEPTITIGPDSVSTFNNIAPGDSVFSNDIYEFTAANAPLPDTLHFILLVIQKTSPGLQKSFEMNVAATPPSDNVTNVVFGLPGDNVSLKMINIVPTLVIQCQDTLLQIAHQLKHILQSGATAATITGRVLDFNHDLIEYDITGSTLFYGDLAPNQPTMMEPPPVFKFVTKVPFLGTEAPAIKFEFSWYEGQGGGNRVTRQLDFKWEPLESFEVRGAIKYFNLDAKRVQGARVKLVTQGRLRDSQTTGSNGEFVFHTMKSDAGTYKITVTHSGVPVNAISSDDVNRAMDLADTQPGRQGSCTGNNEEVYARIAADVDGSGSVTLNDVTRINNRKSPCDRFPVGKDWIFIDPITSVDPSKVATPTDNLTFVLQNYNFQGLNFVGILYGDVNGDANLGASLENTTTCAHFDITGTVRYAQSTGIPVGNTEVTLDGGSFDKLTTAADGIYRFLGVLGGNTYIVTPSKTGGIGSAINSADLTLLRKHFSGQPLNNWQSLLADVNQNQIVDPEDSTLLKHFIGGQVQLGVGYTGQWRFDPVCKTYQSLNSNQSQDFVALLLGDIDGNWIPSSSSRIATESNQTIYPFLHDLEVAPGEVFNLPLRIAPEQRIYSARIDLAFDPTQLEMLAVAKCKPLETGKLNYQQKPGRLEAVLSSVGPAPSAGEVAIVTFRATGKVGESSLLELKKFSVNDGPVMEASARISLIKKIPKEFFLSQNYPNPFSQIPRFAGNPATTIAYGLPVEARVRLQIFNVLGQSVITLVDKQQEAGYYHLAWNGRDQNDRSLSTGVYIIRLEAGKFSQVRKLALLK